MTAAGAGDVVAETTAGLEVSVPEAVTGSMLTGPTEETVDDSVEVEDEERGDGMLVAEEEGGGADDESGLEEIEEVAGGGDGTEKDKVAEEVLVADAEGTCALEFDLDVLDGAAEVVATLLMLLVVVFPTTLGTVFVLMEPALVVCSGGGGEVCSA